MERIPLEDSAADVIAKAQRGLGLDDASLARRASIAVAQLFRARAGEVDTAVLQALASVLKLDAECLVALAGKIWHPEVPTPDSGFAMFTTPFGDGMRVNNFLVWDDTTREAGVFDTGTEVWALLNTVRERGLRVRDIFVTHAHRDHVDALEVLVRATGAPVHISVREQGALATISANLVPFEDGMVFSLGNLLVETRDVRGHSPGQTAFVVGREKPWLAVVGDALFAGSMGGSVNFYREQRRNSIEKILTLPAGTLLAPGHGPLTTVGLERRHNAVLGGKRFSASAT